LIGGVAGALHGGLNPAACFAAGTQVVTGIDPNDPAKLLTRNIEDVQAGDYVVSRDQGDEHDGLDLRRVTRVFRHVVDHLRVIRYEDASGNVETISTTDDHPFCVEGSGWTRAADLRPGRELDEPDGANALVLSSVRAERPGVGRVRFSGPVIRSGGCPRKSGTRAGAMRRWGAGSNGAE
jgi:hypothetical protein